jgi:predicted ATPase
VDAPAEQRLADLENTLRLIGLDPAEHAPLLAPLVDIPLRPERAASFPPEELRRRQLAAMTAWILAAARTQAVVLAFEDLHWADPTSLDLLRALADRGAQAPLLLLATTRPEFRPPWSLRSHHSLISLSPLDRAGVARMVGEISASHALPKEVIEGVSERTGGVPLFVEEVTRLLVERGERGGVQAIPLTLQQSLAARLDRLGPAREVAQIGAVLGRDFAYQLLRGVAELDESALQSSLERLAEADLLFVEGAPPQANYRFKHALIQDAAYESLLKSRRQALHGRAAEALREANAEPEAIAHHFTQAGLDDLAIEWWGKAGDQALRRSAFQEAIAHLGKAIAMADKAATGTAVSASGERRQLHVAYGNALIAARGYAAPETIEAFTRALESAAGETDTSDRFAAEYGLWAASHTRGELPAMRAHAEAFLRDVSARPDSPEACIAHRMAGSTHWFAGEYVEARDCLERALTLLNPGRDDDLAFRFGQDPGIAAMVYLAIVLWPMGDVERAVSLVHDAEARISSLAHIGTQAYGIAHAAMFELMRGDHPRVAANGLELARLARDRDLPTWRDYAVLFEGLANAECSAPAGGLEGMRRGAELMRQQNELVWDGLIKVALAEAEARAGDVDRALAILGEALATSERTGHRAFDAELHRARGELLLKCDPTNPAPAEEALLRAIEIAKQQGTRSFRLRAALALAKLHQTTGRPTEAHAVLAPALEGFSPTPEMPEIAEAETLLAGLAETDQVKAAIARRQRRFDLQTSYSQALLWAKGFASEETMAAFARAGEFAGPAENAAARFGSYDAQCLRSFMRGEYRQAREIAETFVREAEAGGRGAEAGASRRMLGLICLYQGDLKAAKAALERASSDFVPERNKEAKFWGPAGDVTASAFLALTEWHLGEVERARQHIQQAIRRADELADVTTTATALFFRTILESRRDDVCATRFAADALLKLSEEYGMKTYSDEGHVYANWARGRVLDPGVGANAAMQALTAYLAPGNKADAPSLHGSLAELEAMTGEPATALAQIDRGLAIAEETGEHFTDAYLHRLRGEILLKRDPTDPAPAEDAYRTAIAIAKKQAARGYELLASLALAKLYQSTGRPAEAHAVLAPALEGFAPTDEMPEIAEAQALLLAIGASAHARHQ